MKRGRFSEEQIVGILKEHEAGRKIAELARETPRRAHKFPCVLVSRENSGVSPGPRPVQFPLDRSGKCLILFKSTSRSTFESLIRTRKYPCQRRKRAPRKGRPFYSASRAVARTKVALASFRSEPILKNSDSAPAA